MPTGTLHHGLMALHDHHRSAVTKLFSVGSSFFLQVVIASILILLPSASELQTSSYPVYETVQLISPRKFLSRVRSIPAPPIEHSPPSPKILSIQTSSKPTMKPESRAKTDIPALTLGEQIIPPTTGLSIHLVGPRKPLALGALGAETLTASAVKKPIEIQTGTFGDGVPSSRSEKTRLAISETGSFETSGDFTSAKSDLGSGNSKKIGRLTGFGDALTGESETVGNNQHRAPHAVTFDDSTSSRLSGPPDTPRGESRPVEVLSKPDPIYSEEARRLRIEGVVILETEFELDGHVHVVRVNRGLGHGLDEAAINVVESMTCKPAIRNGTPLVFRGIVQVRFQLAF
jgi:TonB family protein